MRVEPRTRRRAARHRPTPGRSCNARACWLTAPSFRDRSLLDPVELRKVLFQIGVAFHLHAALVRTVAARSAFAIDGIERVDDVHTRHDLSERRESHRV